MPKNSIAKFILLLGDVAVIFAALFFTLLLRGRNLVNEFQSFAYGFSVLYLLWIFVIFVLNLYDLHFFKKPIDFFFSLITFSVLASLVGVAYFYFRPELGMTPKTILILNVLSFDILFLCWRYLFNLVLEARGVKEKMVIIGSEPELKEILPQIKKRYQIFGLFAEVCDIRGLNKIISEKKVSTVLLATNNKNLIREIFSTLPLRLYYINFNDLYESITKKVPVSNLDEAWFLEKISKPEGKLEQIVKRLFDVLFSLVGLFFFIVFLPFIAVAIKLDSGDRVFYKQERVGKNRRIFTIYKFRTLKEKSTESREVWREKNGEEVTRVGKFLRRVHLDELPQSWSILKGDISFVGPRAEWLELVKTFEKEVPFYKQRYLVKPGLIGWAQINFPASKSVNEAREKFEYDLYYIKNHSLLLDLEIILKAIKLFLW